MADLSLVPAEDAPKRRPRSRKRHALIEAGATGDRLEILEASLTYTLQALADADCPPYVKSGLLTKVDTLSAGIEAIKAERARAAEEAEAHDGDGDAEAWDASAI